MKPQEIIAELAERLQGSWRYRWWAAGITWAISVLGWLYVSYIPDVYQASARVYVDTNSLIKPLMQGLTAPQNTMNEVQLVSTAVLTRPNLENVARTTDLDLRAKTPQEFEDLVTRMQNRIHVSGGRDNIFTIDFQDKNRDKARDVVAAVLDTFEEDAIGAQGDDVEITEKALAGEIQDHEQRLRSAEAALAEFKKKNLGFMPGESGDYYSRLQNALGEVSGGEERIRQLEERRSELSRQIEGEEPAVGIMPGATSAMTSTCSQSGDLATLQKQLAQLLVDFTEKHPRVVALREQLAALQERCNGEQSTGAARAAASQPGGSLELNPVYQNLKIQLSNTQVELVEAKGQLRAHQEAVTGLRRDVDKIAQVETQLKQLNRDYDVIQARHQELVRRWEDLQAKKRLDPVTDHVQFRRIEPPFALADPVGPNRPLFLAVVLLFGVVVGAAVALGLNELHPTYFSRRSVRQLSGLPVLGSISMLLTPAGHRHRRAGMLVWFAAYASLFASTALLIGFSGSAAAFVRSLTAGISL